MRADFRFSNRPVGVKHFQAKHGRRGRLVRFTVMMAGEAAS
jgi:hypothetical protein